MPLDIQSYYEKGSSMSKIFNELIAMNVTGITLDIWWGRIETNPNEYDFTFYKDLV